MVKPVSKTMFLAVIGGGYVVAFALLMMGIIAMIGGAAAAQNAGANNQDAAMGVAMLGGMGMFMLAIACMWVSAIAFFVLIYKAWSAIQDGQVRATPGKAVGFMLIPFFNLYWMFPAIWGWAQDYNGYIARHKVSTAQMSEGMFLAFLICNFVFPPAAFILMFVVVAKMCDGINAIAGAAPQAAMGAAAGR